MNRISIKELNAFKNIFQDNHVKIFSCIITGRINDTSTYGMSEFSYLKFETYETLAELQKLSNKDFTKNPLINFTIDSPLSLIDIDPTPEN